MTPRRATTAPQSRAGVAPTGTALGLDPDSLAACVSCGLCLPHCPTYRVSGEEALSPRGRIAAMRAVEEGAEMDVSFERSLATCVQCRACETACPSAVPFGALLEAANEALAPRRLRWWQKAAYRVVASRALLRASTVAVVVAQRLRLMPGSLERRLGLPHLAWRRPVLRPTGDDVWLFTGCVMDAWQRPVHEAVLDVLGAMGVGAALPGRGAACCGALHAHAGLRADAVRLAARVMAALPGEAPVLVDSAGCGAALKDYGRLVGTPAAHAFSARVRDVNEWIAARSALLPAPQPGWIRPSVAVQDPCHLRHVQRVEGAVRTVLQPYADLVELGDDGRCCGAGGAYSVVQPRIARSIRAQKLRVIEAAGARIVASANPGCALWLGAAGVHARHPVEIVADALRPAPGPGKAGA